MTTPLTKPRRRALEVLAATHPATCFRSNETVPEKRLLYWQTADWLVDQGYAEAADGRSYYQECRLTGMGISLCRELGIEVAHP